MSHENDTLKFGGPGDAIVMACPPDVNPDDDSVRYYGGLLVCESASAEWRRRIVACVNACAGIPTDQLEIAGVLDNYECMVADFDHIKKRRDELLAALKHLRHNVKATGKRLDLGLAMDVAEEAIASVESDHFRDATKMMPGGADAPADIDDGFVGRIDDAITEALGDAMDCTRVWAAWGYGTMGQDDFVRVADDPGRVMEIRDAVLRVVRATEKGGAA